MDCSQLVLVFCMKIVTSNSHNTVSDFDSVTIQNVSILPEVDCSLCSNEWVQENSILNCLRSTMSKRITIFLSVLNSHDMTS